MTRRRASIGGRLDRYVGGIFVASYATALLVVIGLYFIMDLATNLDDFLEPWVGGGQAPAGVVAQYYLLNLPYLFLQAAPFVTLTAGLFTVSRLLKHNEIAAALAAGISAHRVLAPIFVGGIVSAGLMFGLREMVPDSIAPKRDAFLHMLTHRRPEVVHRNLWVRDLGGSVVRLGEFRPRTNEVREFEATLRTGASYVTIEAPRMVYEVRGGELAWWLEDGVHEEVGEQQRTRPVERLEGFELTPELALTYQRMRSNPLELSFRETRLLAGRDPDNVVYQTLLQYHLTFPLASLVLLLVGLPLLLRPERARGFDGIVSGLMLCVFYFAADFVCRNLGLQGSLDPLLASWIPVLLFGSLGVVLFDAIRT
jgi:lipopolysaccharide export system permease protein